jgi:hypothetical protein
MWRNIKLSTMETPELSSRSAESSERSFDECMGNQEAKARKQSRWMSQLIMEVKEEHDEPEYE